MEIRAVEEQKVFRRADHFEQIHAERSAVGNLRFFGQFVLGVEGLDGAHSEAFVGPEDVAHAEHQQVAFVIEFKSGNRLHVCCLSKK